MGRGDRMAEVRIRSERHGDASWGQEVLLEIWRLGGHFSGAHGASAPLPRPGRVAVSLPLGKNTPPPLDKFLVKDFLSQTSESKSDF